MKINTETSAIATMDYERILDIVQESLQQFSVSELTNLRLSLEGLDKEVKKEIRVKLRKNKLTL